ncbi:sushi domain protein [Ancylostoma duodenale]|uniref:Sushi domain protein n=1 Tax=Ancylostoma duodenale TaxID=51022 RepID=A0A0C2DPV9_9BILA|nr:sushi domain protein [Ancylostoma duodenale]
MVCMTMTQLNSGTALAVSSASLVCAALGPVQNGQLIYSGIAVGGRFPKGTRASVLCNLGYEPFGPTDSICEGGKWSRKVATCESTTEPKCPSLKPPSAGRVMYSSIAPYGPSTTATLSCDLGLSVSGASFLQCTEDGWSPKAFGECKRSFKTPKVPKEQVWIRGRLISFGTYLHRRYQICTVMKNRSDRFRESNGS